jgi:hypothetical protein
MTPSKSLGVFGFNFLILRGVKNFSFVARLFARLSPEKIVLSSSLDFCQVT